MRFGEERERGETEGTKVKVTTKVFILPWRGEDEINWLFGEEGTFPSFCRSCLSIRESSSSLSLCLCFFFTARSPS